MLSNDPYLHRDPWTQLRRHTAARIALGRAGGSLPTAEVLKFALDHAEARDAVHSELDVPSLRAQLSEIDASVVEVSSQASDRAGYLQYPDRGRRLSGASREKVLAMRERGVEIALIIADGLSAAATAAHGATVARALSSRIDIGVVVIARYARVALQDEVGEILGARAAIILLGERPGLGTADSLGAYLVFNPRVGNTDADRNCVSNIRPAGLAPELAADTIAYLVKESLRRQISGVQLKDERGAVALT